MLAAAYCEDTEIRPKASRAPRERRAFRQTSRMRGATSTSTLREQRFPATPHVNPPGTARPMTASRPYRRFSRRANSPRPDSDVGEPRTRVLFLRTGERADDRSTFQNSTLYPRVVLQYHVVASSIHSLTRPRCFLYDDASRNACQEKKRERDRALRETIDTTRRYIAAVAAILPSISFTSCLVSYYLYIRNVRPFVETRHAPPSEISHGGPCRRIDEKESTLAGYRETITSRSLGRIPT